MIDPVTGLAIGGVALGASLIDRLRAENALNEARGYYSNINAPTADELAWIAAHPEYQGDLTASALGPSALESVKPNAELEAAQMVALRQMQGIAANQGLSQGDRARLEMVNASAAQQGRASQDAITQNMRARGISGSGMEMMNRAIAAQGGASARALGGAQLASDAEARALQAMTGSANMAGSMSDRQYGRGANVANARDAIARFNSQNSQGVRERNLGARTQWESGRVNALNTTRANRAAANQAAYNNQMGLAGAKASGQYKAADQYDKWGQGEFQFGGNVLQGMAG